MSDPVTNVQIEDVLSSIRKLVSEEVRAQSRDHIASETASSFAHSNRSATSDQGRDRGNVDRLILTPALRVDRDADTTAEASKADAAPQIDEAAFIHAEPEPEPRPEAELLSLMERVKAAGEKASRIRENRPVGIAELRDPDEVLPEPTSPEKAIESALAALGHDTSDDDLEIGAAARLAQSLQAEGEEDITGEFIADDLTTGDTADAEMTSAEDDADMSWITAATQSDDETLSTPAPEDDHSIVPTFLRHQGVTTLRQRVTEVSAVVSEAGGDWEPEADEETDAAPGPQASLPWSDNEDAAPETVAEAAETEVEAEADDADWAVDPMDDGDYAAMADAVHLRDTGEAQDAAANVEEIAQAFAAQIEDTPEEGAQIAALHPADPAPVQDEVDAEEWSDAEPAAPVAEAEPAAEVADHADETLTEEPVMLDEDMLRDMVSEIVRQELQGALGERITRNVRKLVRREIHRALSAHDII